MGLAVGGIVVLILLFVVVPKGNAETTGGGGSAPPPPGPVILSASDIAYHAQAAGFDGEDLITAVAIALAESSGNASAYNPEVAANTPTGRGSYGLWQIYRKAHPEFDDWDLYDPSNNASAAYSIYSNSGSRFTAWSTFKSSAYVSHLPVVRREVNA